MDLSRFRTSPPVPPERTVETVVEPVHTPPVELEGTERYSYIPDARAAFSSALNPLEEVEVNFSGSMTRKDKVRTARELAGLELARVEGARMAIYGLSALPKADAERVKERATAAALRNLDYTFGADRQQVAFEVTRLRLARATGVIGGFAKKAAQVSLKNIGARIQSP